MGQNTEQKIMELFYESPQRTFTVRDISKKTRIPKSTVQKYLTILKKENLVSKENKASDSLLFRTKKINFYLEEIAQSGLLEELISQLNPSCIILFGGLRKGDSVKESDLDLFIEAPLQKELNLQRYEKKLGHKFQLFIETSLNNLQPPLFNNVVNGIKLYGTFTLK